MREETSMQKGKQAYVQTQFTTVNQGELLLMLYDGTLRFLGQARERMAAGDVAGKGMLISKALDVINELAASINQEVGGELARNLHQLYLMCSAKLLRANLRQDVSLVDEVANIITGLRDAYAQIMTQPDVQAAAQQISNRQTVSAAQVNRPVTMPTAPGLPTGIGRAQAQAAYGQSATMHLAGQSRGVGPKV